MLKVSPTPESRTGGQVDDQVMIAELHRCFMCGGVLEEKGLSDMSPPSL